MFGKIFSVFISSYAESLRLKERYRLLTTRLGLVTVAIGCLIMLVMMYHSWLLIGLPLEGGPIEGFRLKLVAWIVLTIVLVPIAFYAGMVVVYGVFGLLMLALGKFTWQQVINIALHAKYPEEWYGISANSTPRSPST